MKRWIAILGALLFFISPTTLLAESGVKVGLSLEGEMYMGWPTDKWVGTSTGLVTGVYFDMAVNERLMMGLHIDATSFTNYFNDDTYNLIEIGGHIKPVIPMDDYELRPYVGLGFGIMPTIDGTSTHLMIQAGAEFVFHKLLHDEILIGDIGFIMSPDGGIDGVRDMTFPPKFFIRLGLVY